MKNSILKPTKYDDKVVIAINSHDIIHLHFESEIEELPVDNKAGERKRTQQELNKLLINRSSIISGLPEKYQKMIIEGQPFSIKRISTEIISFNNI